MVFLNKTSELLRACNLIAFDAELYHSLDDNFLVVYMFFLLLDHQVHVVFVLLGAIYQLIKAVRLDGVGVGHVLDGTTVDNNLSNHFNFVAAAVAGQPLHGICPGRSSWV